MRFESFVNSERCKTGIVFYMKEVCLRALLIRKDVKLVNYFADMDISLRALLIRKDVKPSVNSILTDVGLRALLIRKDVKRLQ